MRPSVWFWIVSVAALLWYLFGALQFFGSINLSQEFLQPMLDDGKITQEYADFVINLPAWVIALFGVATIGGVLASICLLLRKKIATLLYMISLAAALLMYVNNYVLSGKASIMPVSDYIIAACVIITCIALILFSRQMTKSGVLT